jgi:hypothetical protein
MQLTSKQRQVTSQKTQINKILEEKLIQENEIQRLQQEIANERILQNQLQQQMEQQDITKLTSKIAALKKVDATW